VIRSTTIVALALALTTATIGGALADTTPSADATTATVDATDPCGDTDLLATTDRPTFGTNPCVVKPGAAIVEFCYRNTSTSGPSGSNQTSYPQNRDRVGLFSHVELVLDLPSALRLTTAGASVQGSSDIGTGLKYEFGYFGSFVQGIAAEVVYPTTASGPFSDGRPSFNESYQIGGGIIKNVDFNLTLGANTFSSPNAFAPGNTTTTAFQPTFILGALVAPKTKLNVEVANSSSSGPFTSGQFFGNIFLQHQFAKFILVDVEAAQRFTVVNGTHLSYFGAGGSLRF
jgi:hypothetical protein